MRREYHESAMVVTDGPFGGALIKAPGALCDDGVRRTAYRSSNDGLADTFFSIPAFVNVKRRRVYGWITVETVKGFTVDTDDDPLTVKFHAYKYRKHHMLVASREDRDRAYFEEIKRYAKSRGKFLYVWRHTDGTLRSTIHLGMVDSPSYWTVGPDTGRVVGTNDPK